MTSDPPEIGGGNAVETATHTDENRPQAKRNWSEDIHRWVSVVRTILLESIVPFTILAVAFHLFHHIAWGGYATRDIEIYGTISRFWSDGYIPYRDIYDFKPPLTYAVMRVGFALWGVEAACLWKIFVVTATTCTLAIYVGFRASGRVVAAPIASFGMLTLFVVDPWRIGGHFQNTETFAVLFGCLAFLMAALHQRTPRWWLAMPTGAALAMAVMGKQPAVFYAIPLGFQLCLWGSEGTWLRRLRFVATRGLLAFAGSLLPIGWVLAYFWWHGALDHLLQAVVKDGVEYTRFNRITGAFSVLGRPTSELVSEGLRSPAMWAFAGSIVALVPLTLFRFSRWSVVAWFWLLACYLATVIGPRREVHYIICFLPSLALVVGIAFDALFGDSAERERDRPSSGLFTGAVLAILLFGGSWWQEWYPKRYQNFPTGVRDVRQREMGAEIQGVAQPEDTLLVFDEPYSLYMYAGIPPCTRHIYFDFPHVRPLEDLKRAISEKPSFIFVSHDTKKRLESTEKQAPRIEHLRTVVPEEYTIIFEKPLGIVYRREKRAEDAPIQQ